MKSPSGPPVLARPYRGISAEERRHQRREQLMEAAFEVFSTLGLARVTMRDICAQARLTERYFYDSFRSTEEAFDAVHQRQEELLFARVAQAMMTAPRT
ncbi:MAG TPA: helix-turn-helix domain-containing protein, partial [Aquabacterium sp.]|nr:helix-turn-helix domain-containing protein [Aquabacterium sp.]